MGITAPNKPKFTALDMKINIILAIITLLIIVILIVKLMISKSKEAKFASVFFILFFLVILFLEISSIVNQGYKNLENLTTQISNVTEEKKETRDATNNDLSFDYKTNLSTMTINIFARENIENLKIKITLKDKNNNLLTKYERVVGDISKYQNIDIELNLNILSYSDRLKINYVYYEVIGGTIET